VLWVTGNLRRLPLTLDGKHRLELMAKSDLHRLTPELTRREQTGATSVCFKLRLTHRPVPGLAQRLVHFSHWPILNARPFRSPAVTLLGAAPASPRSASVEHMRVDHGRANILVTEQFLHCANVVTIHQEIRGERMPSRVAGDSLGETRLTDSSLQRSLKQRFVDVMTSLIPGLRMVGFGWTRRRAP
jgi:hypothetical protein